MELAVYPAIFPENLSCGPVYTLKYTTSLAYKRHSMVPKGEVCDHAQVLVMFLFMDYCET